MFNQIVGYIFCFATGILFNMSFLHLFDFYETQNHAMIAKAKRPYLASKLWGVFQLAVGAILMALVKFNLGYNPNTVSLLLGFCFWSILLGIITKRYDKNQKE
jgi:hypothetical protein